MSQASSRSRSPTDTRSPLPELKRFLLHLASERGLAEFPPRLPPRSGRHRRFSQRRRQIAPHGHCHRSAALPPGPDATGTIDAHRRPSPRGSSPAAAIPRHRGSRHAFDSAGARTAQARIFAAQNPQPVAGQSTDFNPRSRLRSLSPRRRDSGASLRKRLASHRIVRGKNSRRQSASRLRAGVGKRNEGAHRSSRPTRS